MFFLGDSFFVAKIDFGSGCLDLQEINQVTTLNRLPSCLQLLRGFTNCIPGLNQEYPMT